MSKKLVCPNCFIILVGIIFTCSAGAANVEPQVYITFDGSLNGTIYTPAPREIDKTGSFRAYTGMEIVSDGMGILTDAAGTRQECFTFNASSFNHNGTTFEGTAFVAEAVFTRTDECDYEAPVIDIGGQCYIRFSDGISAGSWNGYTDVRDDNLQPIPRVERTLHYAIVYDGVFNVDYYVNGIKIFRSDNGSPIEITPLVSWGNIRHNVIDGERQIIGRYDSVSFSTFTGSFDPDADFILPGGPAYPEQASNPGPGPGETEVLWDTNLSWTPGIFANKHDVYLGETFEDVNDAGRNNPLGTLFREDYDANELDPGNFEFEKTYFWRIDEINAPPDSTVFKGETWSFTVESLAYGIPGEKITATASSYMEGQGPDRTVDGSGLVEGLHTNELGDMWLSMSQTDQIWIKYEFNRPYMLHEMYVWNYNGPSILYYYGLKDVTIEYSLDDVNWNQVTDVTELQPGTSKSDYACNNIIDFGDVAAKYVRIIATSNWSNGLLDQFGLSEVRFTQIPVSAREPSPANNSTDAPIDLYFGWKKGREADGHKVFFSEDRQAVIDGTAPVVNVAKSSYGPLSLDLAGTYYWRVDEVNNFQTHPVWEGDVWSFSTEEYLLVDGFETYNDIPAGQAGSDLVYYTWIDGYDNPSSNGSTMGYVTGASLETAIIHGGEYSAPFEYNNSVASLSEITANTSQLDIGSNWTQRGVPEELVVSLYGDPNNSTTERMYVEVNNVKQTFDIDLTLVEWQDVSFDLAASGVNLNNVTTVTIGFEKTGSTGGFGTVFIDDIRLYLPLAD